MIHFPSLDAMFRPSRGQHHTVVTLPGQRDGLPYRLEDVGPQVLTRYRLDELEFCEWAEVPDGRGALLVGAGQSGGLISTVTPLDPITRYGISGEFGWEDFLEALENGHPINDSSAGPPSHAPDVTAERPVASSDSQHASPEWIQISGVMVVGLAITGLRNSGVTSWDECAWQLLTAKECIVALRRGQDPTGTQMLLTHFDSTFGTTQPALNEMHIDRDPPEAVLVRVEALKVALLTGFGSPCDRDEAAAWSNDALITFWERGAGSPLLGARQRAALVVALSMKTVYDEEIETGSADGAARFEAAAEACSQWSRRWGDIVSAYMD